MNQFREDLADLMAELENISFLLDDGNSEEALDELEAQRGTIDTMLTKAGR